MSRMTRIYDTIQETYGTRVFTFATVLAGVVVASIVCATIVLGLIPATRALDAVARVKPLTPVRSQESK